MDPRTLNHPSNIPDPAFRPQNISRPMPDIDVIYVETAMSTSQEDHAGHGTQGQGHGNGQGQGQGHGHGHGQGAGNANGSANGNVNMSDVAGVLRRNQACLACRRRKLKCDATRPHCATCVRSYKHLLRTAPRSNPVLSCDYDDSPHDEGDKGGSAGAAETGSAGEEEDGAGTSRKKRKAGDGKRKKDSLGPKDTEAEKLRKKIEELEAQLAEKNHGGSASASAGGSQQVSPNGVEPNQPNRSWSASQPFQDVPVVSSPTAFLEMLSSAATAQTPATGPAPGLRFGASESTMMTGDVGMTFDVTSLPRKEAGESSGWTPLFIFDEQQQGATNGGVLPRQNTKQSSTSSNANAPIDPSRPSSSSDATSASMPHIPTGFTPFTNPAALSPNGIFNFSPGPSGPTAQTPAAGLATQNISDKYSMPVFNEAGRLSPSKNIDGPWRAVETVENTYQHIMNAAGGAPDQSVPMGFGTTGVTDGLDGFLPVDEALQQQLLLDLFWPGWPVNMPEPHIVNDLIEAFFDAVPGLPRMLHRSRFLARMALPPTHSNFPHPALVHAVCSIASNWCAPSVYERSNAAKAVDGKGKLVPFSLRQASLAKEAVHDGLNTGNRMFDVVRAMMILSRIFIDDTRMLECWAYNGLVARMILPLGLNVRSAELSLKSVMLPPPADALEREERRAAMWFALYHDTISSSASGWGTSLALDELTIPLPVSAEEFEKGSEMMEHNPQDLESPDFYSRHPVADPFIMLLKSIVLMNRVNKFVRKWKNRHLRDDDDFDGMQKPEFKELSNSIALFQMSFPQSLRNVCKRNAKKQLDIDLISAHLLPHAALICLYEPFADLTDPNDGPSRRLQTASQAIVNVVQQLASSVNDGAQNFHAIMHSSASVCLVTAARTSLMFYRHALNLQDHQSASAHRMDIEMVRMALSQYGLRFKIGHHHAQLIEYFLDRASNPTLEKLQAHYPEHPRPGAPELHSNCDLGICVMNALNVKRGFWRIAATQPNSTGISPFGSTPDSASALHRNSISSVSGGLRDSDSPNNNPGSASSGNNAAGVNFGGSGPSNSTGNTPTGGLSTGGTGIPSCANVMLGGGAPTISGAGNAPTPPYSWSLRPEDEKRFDSWGKPMPDGSLNFHFQGKTGQDST